MRRSNRRRSWFLPLLTAFCIGPSASALATAAEPGGAYPERPVRFVVPFPPAGGTDIVARLLAQRLTERLGQTFVIDNRPGAASTIGSAIAARAAPDGYTLLLVTSSYAMSASYYRKLPYDSVADFAGISRIASGPLLFTVHPSVAATSIKDLIALAKAAPGKLNYASGGAGGINHLAGELLDTLAGVKLVHIAYKGAGPALNGPIAGEVQLMIATLASALPHVRAGKLRGLAVAGERRAAAAPEFPTVAEAGLQGYSADNWYGLLTPRGTPATIIGRLNREIGAVLRSHDVQSQLTNLGFEAMSSTPHELETFLRQDIEKWAKVMDAAGIKE